MAFRVSLFVVIDLVKLGCVVSEVCCSILEIDLVKQAFLVRFFLFFPIALLLKLTLVELFLLQKQMFLVRTIFYEMLFRFALLLKWALVELLQRIFLVLLPYVACLSLCHSL